MLNGRNRPHYRLVIPIILSAALAFLLSGCLWGFVTDADTGDPIGGATVSYTDANGDTDSTTTNAHGIYSFDQADGPYPASGSVAFEISAPGYDPLTKTRPVGYNDNANATLADLSSFWEIQSFKLQPTAAEPAKIVFSSARDGNNEIYVMDADGSGQTRLTSNPAADGYPAWSPDGSKIAFTSDRDGNLEIYVMNADGTGQTRITNNAAADVYPAWSPDGSKIAFTSNRDGNLEVYVMNANGSGQTNLTGSAGEDSLPSWSPDGSEIAFTTARDGNDEIYVMNDSGGGQTNLTNDPANDRHPTWSPDGSQIAFNSSRDGNLEIYVMDDNGSDQTRLTHNSAVDYAPDW
jgi:Tol biopolymer transport system component